MMTLEQAYAKTAAFVESIPKKERKRYGQFFTSKKSASFMASLFTPDNNDKGAKIKENSKNITEI